MRLVCKWCSCEMDIDPVIFQKRRDLGILMCEKCRGSELVVVPGKCRRSDNQKRSQTQEKHAAKRYGARRQKASGAIPGVKGDLRDPGRLRGECKLTRAASYTLKLEELRKLEHESTAGEIPMFEIEFQNNPPFKRYVVLPQWAFDQLYSAWRAVSD